MEDYNTCIICKQTFQKTDRINLVNGDHAILFRHNHCK